MPDGVKWERHEPSGAGAWWSWLSDWRLLKVDAEQSKACVGRHGQRTEHYPTASSLASSQAQTFLSRPLPGADMFLFCPIVTASTGGWCTHMCLSRLGDCNLRTLCPCLLWAPTTWPGIQLDPSMCATLEASEHRVTKGDISESFSWPQTMAVTTSFLSPLL